MARDPRGEWHSTLVGEESDRHRHTGGRRFGLDWPALAAVGRVASDHGRLTTDCRPNRAGAIGPMQFLAASFAQASAWAGLRDTDICDPAAAIPAAAAYLAHFGAPDDWRRALSAYHPSDAYVDLVLAWAQRYGYAATLVWPIDGPITQRFGPTDFELEPALWYRGQWYPRFHAGIDIALGWEWRAAARDFGAHRIRTGIEPET